MRPSSTLCQRRVAQSPRGLVFGGASQRCWAARPSRGGLTMCAAAGEVLSMSADFGGGRRRGQGAVGGKGFWAPLWNEGARGHVWVGRGLLPAVARQREFPRSDPPSNDASRAGRQTGGGAAPCACCRDRPSAGVAGGRGGSIPQELRRGKRAPRHPDRMPPGPTAGCCHDPVSGGAAAAVGIGCCLAHSYAAVPRIHGRGTSGSSPAPMGALVCGGGGDGSGRGGVGGGEGQVGDAAGRRPARPPTARTRRTHSE